MNGSNENGESTRAQGKPARVEFADQPQKRNEQFAQAVAKFISDDSRFDGQKVRVQFPQTGATSFVCFLATDEGKMVFKVPSKPGYHAGELKAFAAWEKRGVAAPHIFENGTVEIVKDDTAETQPYVLMSYIGEKPLNEAHTRDELLTEGIYADMGTLLRDMHETTPEEAGFGLIGPEGEAQFKHFGEWMNSEKMQKHIAYVIENGLADADAIAKARTVLLEYAEKNPRTTYCHMDFSPQNVFATEPLTVFDPGIELNLPYIDVGKTVVCNVPDGEEAIEQILSGYERGDNKSALPLRLDRKVIQAAVVITALRKLVFLHKNAHEEKYAGRVEALQKYFADHSSLLES